MAENKHIFDNDDVFTKNNEIDETVELNNSETLATQGNVINSLKIFWARLRAKLKYAVTRSKLGTAVGGNYQPVYVDSNGVITPCTPTLYSRTITNGKIDLPNEFPLYSGQIVCINVSDITGSNNTTLKIKDVPVYYPTDVAVKGSDINNGLYMFSYIGGEDNKWILNNKINVASDSNPGLMTKEQYNKLKGIQEGANYFTYTLPTASTNEKGGVKSSSNITTDSNNKIYHVGVDNNGIMTVQVPWQNTHNEASLSLVTDSNNYPIIRLTDGNNTTNIPITSAGGASVYINNNTLVIEAPQLIEYNILKTDSFNNHNSSSLSYTVYGPGPTNATTNYYLAGNGTWVRGILVPIPGNGASGRILKCNENGTPYWANAE